MKAISAIRRNPPFKACRGTPVCWESSCVKFGLKPSSSPVMGLRVGQEIASGQYQVTKELGQGRNCVSYLVRDRHQHNWAIKTWRDEVWEGLSHEDRDRVQNKLLAEAMMLATLQHPHIVRFKEPLTENGRVYLVMEHIAGDDLATISPRTLPEDDALLYLQQIASALHAVHEAKLVHRDIKPANIMLRAVDNSPSLRSGDSRFIGRV